MQLQMIWKRWLEEWLNWRLNVMKTGWQRYLMIYLKSHQFDSYLTLIWSLFDCFVIGVWSVKKKHFQSFIVWACYYKVINEIEHTWAIKSITTALLACLLWDIIITLILFEIYIAINVNWYFLLNKREVVLLWYAFRL